MAIHMRTQLQIEDDDGSLVENGEQHELDIDDVEI